MKKKPSHINLLVFFMLNFLSGIDVFAANPAPPQPQPLGPPPPGVPIDLYIPILLLTGILIAYYYFKKEYSLNKKAPK